MEAIRCREAKISDQLGITELSKDIYGGTDYTASIFPQWIADQNYYPFVAETVSGQLVGFLALVITDNGRSVVGRSVRVSQPYRKRGISTMLSNHALISVAQQFPQVNSMLVMNQVGKTLSFNWDEKLKMSAGVIQCNVHIIALYVESYIHRDRAVYEDTGKHKVAFTTFDEIYNHDESLRAIFPDNIITVGGDIMHANIPETRSYLDGREELKFLFTKSLENDGSAVFSVLNLFGNNKNEVGQLVFDLNLFGNDSTMLKYHILEAMNSAMQVSEGNFVIQLYIASPIDGGAKVDVVDFIRQGHWGQIKFYAPEHVVEHGIGTPT